MGKRGPKLGTLTVVVSDETLAAMVEAYTKGAPVIRIASRFGISETTVRRIFLAAGVALRPPARREAKAANANG